MLLWTQSDRLPSYVNITSRVMQEFIAREFGVTFHVRHVPRLLRNCAMYFKRDRSLYCDQWEWRPMRWRRALAGAAGEWQRAQAPASESDTNARPHESADVSVADA